MPSGLQADVFANDIKMQGVSLTELLSKYFLHRSTRLLPDAYWTNFRGFDIKLHVSSLSSAIPCLVPLHFTNQVLLCDIL